MLSRTCISSHIRRGMLGLDGPGGVFQPQRFPGALTPARVGTEPLGSPQSPGADAEQSPGPPCPCPRGSGGVAAVLGYF